MIPTQRYQHRNLSTDHRDQEQNQRPDPLMQPHLSKAVRRVSDPRWASQPTEIQHKASIHAEALELHPPVELCVFKSVPQSNHLHAQTAAILIFRNGRCSTMTTAVRKLRTHTHPNQKEIAYRFAHSLLSEPKKRMA